MKRNNYASNAFVKLLRPSLFTAVLLSSIIAGAQSFTVWDSTSVTDVPSSESNDGDSIEVGFKFKVTQIGTIKAIRYYKYSGNGNNSNYTGTLWTNGNSTTPGTSLSTGSHTNVSGAGWVTIDIPDYTLLPNTVYVVSVLLPSGWYSYTNGGFPTNSDDYGHPPFVIVANNTDPAGVGNGVYHFGGSGFPSTVFAGSTNYWVDLMFTTTFSLPVSLSDFKATTTGSNVLISWKTDHESNNKGFEIQRSNNGSDWYAINFIDGTGESTVTKNYNYTDKALAPGTYFYRLRQVDFDNKNTFSAIVSATVSGKGTVSLFQNYPNPFSGTTSIRFDLPKTQHARLTLVDLAGREVRVLTDRVSEAGSHIITLNGENLGKQTYLVRLQTENGVLTRKIVVK